MKQQYTFEVYSRRRGYENTYRIEKLNEGWYIGFKAHSGKCDKEGSPYLAGNFNQDSINYPKRIGFYMEWIWDDLHNNKIDEVTAQERLQQLADWVSETEKSTPDTIEWERATE